MGSGIKKIRIWDKHPGSATLINSKFSKNICLGSWSNKTLERILKTIKKNITKEKYVGN
jgi:hypothetical protein